MILSELRKEEYVYLKRNVHLDFLEREKQVGCINSYLERKKQVGCINFYLEREKRVGCINFYLERKKQVGCINFELFLRRAPAAAPAILVR